TLVTIETINEYFGQEVARLVDGVTKVSNLGKTSKEQVEAESFRKLMLATVDDIRVILVKLADRLHNMRTLKYLKPEKRKVMAEETLNVYVPIANRLGMGKLRVELEDLSFKYLEPEIYEELSEAIDEKKAFLNEFLMRLKEQISGYLNEEGISIVMLEGRIKHIYGIHKKMLKYRIPLPQVHDLVAIRIITNEEMDCYKALG